MNPQQILDYLNSREGASEAALVSSYHVDIDNREVTVEIHDHGVAAGEYRFFVSAEWSTRDDDESAANFGSSVANPAATLEDALGDINWWVFRSRD